MAIELTMCSMEKLAAELLFCGARRAGLFEAPQAGENDGADDVPTWWKRFALPFLARYELTRDFSGIYVATQTALALNEAEVRRRWDARRAALGADVPDGLVLFETDIERLPEILTGVVAPAAPYRRAPGTITSMVNAIIRRYCEADFARGRTGNVQLGYLDANTGADISPVTGMDRVLFDLADTTASFDIIVAGPSFASGQREVLRDIKAHLPARGVVIFQERFWPPDSAPSPLDGLTVWAEMTDDHDADGLEDLLASEGFQYFFALEDARDDGWQVVVAESDGASLTRTAKADDGITRALSSKTVATDEQASSIELLPATTTFLVDGLSMALRLDSDQIATDRPFAEYGLDSLLGVRFVNHINKTIAIDLNTTVIFEHPSIDALAQYMSTHHAKRLVHALQGTAVQERVQAAENVVGERPAGGVHRPFADTDVAVIGMSGMFPLAEDVDALWQNLWQGIDAVGELPPDYLTPASGSEGETGRAICRWGAPLNGRDSFDPLFFNLSPADAEAMSPHQRLVLQESWRAIEDGGYDPKSLSGSSVGVFVGAEPSGFSENSFTGASEAIVATRLSYFLNLRGQALVVNTGCSSSAMAIHLACESLRSGATAVCLAGGVNAALRGSVLKELSAAGMLSPTGRCRTFDAAADGTVIAEAVGIVMLKRLSDALRDGDLIHGVICASGANQDGTSNGITAPNGAAQEALIEDTYRRFGIAPDDISYVEAHGTGTPLGDPVEVNALVRAFGGRATHIPSCRLGSVKANLGHAAAASGVVGLIKLLLCLRHRRLPGQLNFAQTNPRLMLEGSALEIGRARDEWRPAACGRRVAALNSFGHSGTNVHIVVREAPGATGPASTSHLRGLGLAPISARSPASLLANADALLRYLERAEASGAMPAFTDLCHGLQTTREAMPFRLIFTSYDIEGLIAGLRAVVAGGIGAESPAGVPAWHWGLQPSKAARPAKSADLRPEALALAWSKGAQVDWPGFWRQLDVSPGRVRLPTYRFEIESYPIRWPEERPHERAAAHAAPSTQIDDKQTGMMEVLTQRWTSHAVPVHAVEPHLDDILVIGGEALSESVRARFAPADLVDHGADLAQRVIARLTTDRGKCRILWLAPSSSGALSDMIDAQDGGVLDVFRLFAALKTAGLVDRNLKWAFVTILAIPVSDEERADPTHVAVHGLAGVMAKEFPRWEARTLDVDATDCIVESWFWDGDWPTETGNVALRGGLLLKQCLLPVRVSPSDNAALQRGGVYIIVGGAGGLGRIWSRHAIRNYGVQLVWLGRRTLDDEISGQIAALAELGPAPLYLSLDARDAAALRAAIVEVKARFRSIDGIIHAAVGAFDLALSLGDERRFRDILSTKIDISVALVQLATDERIGVLIFFSSLASFHKTAGMAGYVSGCLFKDGLAQWCTHAVPKTRAKVVNWGYWEAGTGLRVSENSRTRWRNSGISAINPEDGMALLDAFLTSPLGQIAATSRRQPNTDADGGAWIDIVSAPIEGSERRLSFPYAIQTSPKILSALDPRNDALDDILLKLLSVQLAEIGCGDEKAAADYPHPFEKWLQASLRLLRGTNLSPDRESRDELWRAWEDMMATATDGSGTPANLALLDACIRALPAVLKQGRKPTDVLFPAGSMALVEAVYKTNAVAAYFNQQLAIVIESMISDLVEHEPGARIRILEIGAGTGGTTEHLLPVIDAFAENIIEYRYTDISRYFLSHAMDNFMIGRPCVQVGLLNIENDVVEQGFDSGGYDIVLATNALHATRCIRDTLANVKSLLRPGGAILISEISTTSLFTHLTFGLLDGWWAAEDQETRLPGSPGLAPAQWRGLLELEGFKSISFPVVDAHVLGNQLIVATSDGIVRLSGQLPFDELDRLTSGTAGTIKPPVNGAPPSTFAKLVVENCAAVLKMRPDDIDVAESLERYGVDSLVIVDITKRLEKALGPIDSAIFFDVPSISALVDRLYETNGAALASEPPAPTIHAAPGLLVTPTSGPAPGYDEPIAIVGIAGRYPMSPTLADFWDNLAAGRDCVSEFANDRWQLEGFLAPTVTDAIETGRSYSRRCGVLEGFADFDADFFGIDSATALNMDPQERLLVQSCWHVLEDAGYTRQSLRDEHDSNVGVFLGITRNGHTLRGRDIWRPGTPYPFSSFSSAANRISFLLDLKGPSMPVDTMCSSSLTAIHQACMHLRSGDCVMAIAGGVNLYLHPADYIGFCADRMISPAGRTRSFGADGDGFVPGEGVGTVLLKRYSEAVEDGDNIHAVIRAAHVNHGGRSMGYATPNPSAQRQLVSRALEKAGLRPEDVTYVEGHGTGTEFGDAIEVSSLAKAYASTEESRWCALGSCKPNIGHLEAAAGVAALTKVVLQMRHRTLAPSLYSDKPNPRLRLEGSPFVLQQNLTPWTSGARGNGEMHAPLFAAVSAFGAAGSNAHVIVQEHVKTVVSRTSCPAARTILPLSAPSVERLRLVVSGMIDWLMEHQNMAHELPSEPELADIGYTLQIGREPMSDRVAVVATDVADAITALKRRAEDLENSMSRDSAQADDEQVARLIANEDLDELAAAWEAGAPVNWAKLHGSTRRQRVSLPLYPFRQMTFWQPNLVGPYLDRGQQLPAANIVKVGQDSRTDVQVIAPARRDDLAKYLSLWLAEEVGTESSGISEEMTFFELGVTSAGLVRLMQALDAERGLDIDPAVLFEHNSVGTLATFLTGETAEDIAAAHTELQSRGSTG